jgi:hypothetical protein
MFFLTGILYYPELKEAKWYLFSQDDEQSFIYLLKHNATGKYVGTVRVFFINSHTPIQKLPMQKDGHIQDIDHLMQVLPIVEISRGTLIQDLPHCNDLSALQLRTILTYGLMIATRINFILYPNSMVFSIMESSLHYILKRQGVNFEQISDTVNYYGQRTPYAIETPIQIISAISPQSSS